MDTAADLTATAAISMTRMGSVDDSIDIQAHVRQGWLSTGAAMHFGFLAASILTASVITPALAAPLEQAVIERAMRAAMPSEAVCERGGEYKAACKLERSPTNFGFFAIYLTKSDHIVIEAHDVERGRIGFRQDALVRFFEDIGLKPDTRLTVCWASAVMKSEQSGSGRAEWLTADFVTTCSAHNNQLIIETQLNNRF